MVDRNLIREFHVDEEELEQTLKESLADIGRDDTEMDVLYDERARTFDVNQVIDGVILRDGMKSATFLPQVWEQLPRTEDFLSRLCLKAGLAANAWQTKKLDILTYQVQHFSE